MAELTSIEIDSVASHDITLAERSCWRFLRSLNFGKNHPKENEFVWKPSLNSSVKIWFITMNAICEKCGELTIDLEFKRNPPEGIFRVGKRTSLPLTRSHRDLHQMDGVQIVRKRPIPLLGSLSLNHSERTCTTTPTSRHTHNQTEISSSFPSVWVAEHLYTNT